jgi:hypothetical protein
VRRHAKASTAESTKRQAGRLGRAARGAFATRGPSLNANGSGAPRHPRKLLGAALLAQVVAIALAASPAIATETHSYTGTSFGPDGTTATSFLNAQGLALDQSSEAVYVYDSGAGSIYKFDAAGNPVNFSALTGNAIEGVGGAGAGEEELAVAPAGAPGGTAGDIYAANNFVVKVYAPSGLELGQLSGGETCGVATNPAGHVFVGAYPSTVTEYVPSANPPTNADESAASIAELPGICNVAADGLGTVYAANYNGAGIARLEGLTDPSPSLIEPGGSSVAVDPSTNDLYTARGAEVSQYSSSGTLINSFRSERLSNSHGIAVNGTTGKVYVNGDAGRVAVFGPLVTVPTVATSPATGIGARRAMPRGTVNPENIAVTECRFEYGTTTAYGESAPCVGSIPTDSSNHAPSAELTGLLPHTTYHFRLVAENANGSNTSADQTFTTEATAKTGAGTGLTGTKAALQGTVFPEGEPITECRFEYGETASYGLSIGCAESSAEIGSGEEPVSVHAEIAGLQPSTKYHFRLVAKAEALPQAEVGGDATFTTPGPLIESSAVDGGAITPTAAGIDATVNPQGQGTSVHVEYVTQSEFEASGFVNAALAPPGANGIGNGSSGHALAIQLTGLQPNVSYRARVAATNLSGTVYGPILAFATYPEYNSLGACPANEAFRTGPSAALPDCRAYEQATPIDKNGNNVRGQTWRVQASLSGDAITSLNSGGLPGGEGSQTYPVFVSQRGPTEWSTQGLLPPPSLAPNATVNSWTRDLHYSFSIVSRNDPVTGLLLFSLVMRSSADHTIRQIFPFRRGGADIAGVSADASRVFFTAGGPVPLTPDAVPGVNNLYLYEPGSERLSLVGVLPTVLGGHAPEGGTFAGTGTNLNTIVEKEHPISDDGDRAFFTDAGTGQIYLREGLDGASPETLSVSASQRAIPDPNGTQPPTFISATPSGSVGFFTSCEKLTDDSTAHSTGPAGEQGCSAPNQGSDLYAYDASTHLLHDLTVDAGDPLGADVIGVLGTSDDGEYVYFVAKGDLDGGGAAESTEETNSINLYLWHAGATELVAKIAVFDFSNWFAEGERESVESNTGRVSADGKTVVFYTAQRLTEYENIAPDKSAAGEFYRYNTQTGLTCVSCNPTGLPPTGVPPPGTVRLGSIEPALISSFGTHPLLFHFVSTDGSRVFFESRDKLVPADTNGDQTCPTINDPGFRVVYTCQDVYEWEAPGKGSCTEGGPAYSSQDKGCLYLLSTGTSSAPSYFGDASASGDDAFVFTGAQLVPQDKDHLQDIYDASVDGGLASQHPVVPPSCEGEACRGSGTAPGTATGAGTAGFEGAGNPTPRPKCRKNFARRHGRCVKVKKRHHHRSHKRADHHRGGGK